GPTTAPPAYGSAAAAVIGPPRAAARADGRTAALALRGALPPAGAAAAGGAALARRGVARATPDRGGDHTPAVKGNRLGRKARAGAAPHGGAGFSPHQRERARARGQPARTVDEGHGRPEARRPGAPRRRTTTRVGPGPGR